jgi:hypothetical protein
LIKAIYLLPSALADGHDEIKPACRQRDEISKRESHFSDGMEKIFKSEINSYK